MKHTSKSLLLFVFFMLALEVNAQLFHWARKVGGSNSDVGRRIAADASGNVYVVGDLSGTVDMDPGAGVFNLTSAGSTDIFILKLNSSGNFLWAKKVGSTSVDVCGDIALDPSGNLLITGQFNGTVDFDPNAGSTSLTSSGVGDIFVMKLSSAGNLVWARRIGGTGNDYGAGIAVDASNVYITGSYNGTVDFNPAAGVFNLTSAGSTDLFICKLSSTGNFVWARSSGGTSSETGMSVCIDPSGNVITVGYFAGTADLNPDAGVLNRTAVGSLDISVIKLNSAGTFQWAVAFGGTGFDQGHAIKSDGSGNIVLSGRFEGTVDFNPSATVQNLTSAGGADIFISKLTTTGALSWVRRIGNTSTDIAYGMAIDDNDNIYTTGIFGLLTDFNPGAGTANIGSGGARDIFVSKLNSAGNYVWAVSIGASSTGEDSYGIDVLNSNYVHVTGDYNGTVDFNPYAGVSNLTTGGSFDAFVVKLGQFDPLPIELLGFDAKVKSNLVELTWATASETNNDYFTIERSHDGERWNEIQTIAGAGTTTELINYHSVDRRPLDGISYYRLKQTDYDGKFSYSDVRVIRIKPGNDDLLVYPNPVQSKLFIEGVNELAEELKIFDLTGRDLTRFLRLETGENKIIIADLSLLARGVYIIRRGESSARIQKCE